MQLTLREQKHEAHLVSVISKLDSEREVLRDERDTLCKALIQAYTRPVYDAWKERYERFRANPKFKEQKDELLELLIAYEHREKIGACTKIIVTNKKEIAAQKLARMKEHLKFGDPVYENQ